MYEAVVYEHYYGKSGLFRDVFDGVMSYMRSYCKKPSDCMDATVFKDDKICCYIRCYHDGYRISYIGYQPMVFRFDVKIEVNSNE